MEQVVLKGVTYTKAAAVAKKFGYTSDYVGQLCRKKKVKCELVGRSWFVNEDSVEEHKSGRYKQKEDKPADEASTEIKIRNIDKNRSDEKTNDSNVRIKNDDKKYRVAINPREHKATIKKDREPSKFAQRISWSKAIYRPDEDELMPTLIKKEGPDKEAIKLNVDPAESKKLAVDTEGDAETSMEPTELPSVSLTGTLRIKSYDPELEVEDDENTAKNIDITKPQRQLQNTRGAITMERKAAPVSFTPQSVKDGQTRFQARLARALEEEPRRDEESFVENVPQTTPESLVEAPELTLEDEEKPTVWRFLPSPVITILFGLIFAVLTVAVLLSIEGSTVASGDTLDDGTVLNMRALEDLF